MRPSGCRLVALLLMAATLLVNGCYLPERFDAEIEITRYGTYKITFDGYLVSLPLYEGLRKNEIKPAEERQKVDVIRRDLTRDSATKRATYLRKGIFNVHWEKSGDLTQDPMVTFLRRNQAFLTLKFLQTTGRGDDRGRQHQRRPGAAPGRPRSRHGGPDPHQDPGPRRQSQR